jgi:hypothetical protein
MMAGFFTKTPYSVYRAENNKELPAEVQAALDAEWKQKDDAKAACHQAVLGVKARWGVQLSPKTWGRKTKENSYRDFLCVNLEKWGNSGCKFTLPEKLPTRPNGFKCPKRKLQDSFPLFEEVVETSLQDPERMNPPGPIGLSDF